MKELRRLVESGELANIVSRNKKLLLIQQFVKMQNERINLIESYPSTEASK